MVVLAGWNTIHFVQLWWANTFWANVDDDPARLPRFKASTNYDNYVAVDTWTKLGANNTGATTRAFDAGNNRFVAPVEGTYRRDAALQDQARISARM